jgi:uncharacterized protein YkwD
MALNVRRTSLAWLVVVAGACTSPAGPTDVEGAPSPASAVVQLTNVERDKAGIPTLRSSSRLMEAAQLHADQMARLGRFDHVLPGAQYPRPEDRLAAVDYEWMGYGENIAMGQSTPAAALDSWMRSSGHRANILNTNLTEIGIGLARDSSNRPYWVQVFGKPR